MPEQRLRYPVLISILAACLTLGLKYVAYHLTGSVGLLSEAAEAIVNLLAAVAALLSLLYAARPVDTSHTYGHEKIEFFSSGLEGTLILAAAAGIAWVSVQRFLVPAVPHSLDVGIAVSLLASLINFAVARLLLRVGRAEGSIILEANGKHLMTDVWTSIAVVVGVAFVWLTKVAWLDPLLGMVVSANILWTAYDLLSRSFNGLMDHSLSMAEQELVRGAIEKLLEEGMDYHALRTRQGGSRRFADFHLLVPGASSVREAHELASRIEEAVQTLLPNIEVTIHIEPIEERSAWEDSALVPLERSLREAREKKPGESPGAP